MEKRKINVSIEKTRDAGEENKETPKGSGKQERRNERWREKKEKETVARGRGERSPDGRTKLDAEPRDEAAKPARKVNRAGKRERAQPGAQDGNRPSPRAQRLGDGRRAGAQANKSDSPKSPRGRSNLGAGRLMPPRKRVKAEQKFSAALTSLTTK